MYDLVKHAGGMKEDDVTVSGFGFRTENMSGERVAELLLQAEKKFEAENKKCMG